MLNSNYIKVAGEKKVRTLDSNFIKLFTINTIPTVVKDSQQYVAFRLHDLTKDSYSFKDFILTVWTISGVSDCTIRNTGNNFSTDITVKVIKDLNKFTVCARGHNSWQDITIQVLYSNCPNDIEVPLTDEYITIDKLNTLTTISPTYASYSFIPGSKIFNDASYHNDIKINLGYATVNLGLYTQGDTVIENGTVIGTLPVKPYSKPLIANVVWYTINTDNHQSGVCPVEINNTTGNVIARGTIPPKCRIGLNVNYKVTNFI